MQYRSQYSGDINVLKHKALKWATSFDVASCFNSNGNPDPYGKFDLLIAAGARTQITGSAGNSLSSLSSFLGGKECWLPGYLSYDLKNEIERLESENPDYLNFSPLFFFEPEHLIIVRGGDLHILSDNKHLLAEIESLDIPSTELTSRVEFSTRFSKQEYIDRVNGIKSHIKRGDIYELNFCQEFFAEKADVDPLALYLRLNTLSPTPFSAFFKNKKAYIISASPERYLCRRGSKIVSQPIKGTAPRHQDRSVDEYNKQALRNNEKEQAENVMIVDLVRNDLTKIATKGSVHVEELFGIYSFPQVHQMISTVACHVQEETDNVEIIKASFPMGSMTGAPKIRAMELIDHFELNSRSIYSGAIGYFSPEGDFDFNVVIRSLCYNAETKYLSFQTGSAITFASDAEAEYQECLLKGKAIFDAINA